MCGLQTVADVKYAAALGVDAIGLVFHAKSTRNVGLFQAKQLCAATPAFMTTVALFRNASESSVAAVANSGMVDCLQFHGDESAEFCQQFGVPYIKAIGMGGGKPSEQLLEEISSFSSSRGILLDSHSANKDGGSGASFDWANIPVAINMPIILAGGLNVQNVAAAIKQVNPYAVDVSSGIESAPGVKNQRLMLEFVKQVNQ